MSCIANGSMKVDAYRWLYPSICIVLLMLFCPLINADSYVVKQANIDNEKKDKSIIKIITPVYVKETDKKFFDVVEDLLISIGDNNFRLTQHARIGEAIAKRDNMSFPLATVIHFCNLHYAKQILVKAPDFLSKMPCRISVRQTTNNVVIETLLLPENDQRVGPLAKEINAILIGIVTDGAS